MADVTADEIRRGLGAVKDLEREMEQILEPLGVAVDAAGDVLRHYGYEMGNPLAPQVAEIVGCAVNTAYEITYRNLIEFARRAKLPEEAARRGSHGS